MPQAADSHRPALAGHGAHRLPSVTVDSYNAEIKDENGFVGDRASGRAFREMLDEVRDSLKKVDADPLGKTPSKDLSKKKLDKLLAAGDPEIGGIIHGAIEGYAQELAAVVRRFLKLKDWRGTERIAVGGGLRDSRVGELAVGRASVILKGDGIDIDLVVIRHHPDEAGLIGAAHLAPAWVFQGHDSIVAIDIGGSNIRCGVVELNLRKAKDLSKAQVWKSELWRHSDDKPGREAAVDRIVKMVRSLVRQAEKEGKRLAPLIGIGCPGLIAPDGSIERGGQNLPGNWESEGFNLPERIRDDVGEIDDHETTVLMHNDAVVQGLSQTPFMQDIAHWGVLTVGTGLGNARFSNRGKGE